MFKNNVLTQQDFDALLQWFSPNRDEAGAKYEEIRNGLIRYFHFRGCADVEILADVTINRLAGKLSSLDKNNNNKHITYFYGFAAKVYLEYLRSEENQRIEIGDENLLNIKTAVSSEENRDERLDCLDNCLAQLSDKDKSLIIEYFSKEKSEKIEIRRNLSEREGLNMGTLQVKIYRLKMSLKNCVEKCLKQNKM